MRRRILTPKARALLLTTLAIGTPGLGAGVVTMGSITRAHAAAPGPTAPLRLTSFAVHGNDRVPTDAIMGVLPFHAGDTVTRNDIDAGIQKIAALYQEKNVGASFKTRDRFVDKTIGVELVIAEQAPDAAPAPVALVLDKVAFTGNARVTSSELMAATKLVPGQPVTNESVAAATKAVLGVYKAHDLNAQIQPVASYPHHDNHVVLTYQITEAKSASDN